MLIEMQIRQCVRCGHRFRHMPGDFVLELMPKCPLCGSRLTMKIKEGMI